MKGKLAGRIAIVTGGGANIGEASARALAREGATVIVADLNVAGAEHVADDIVRAGLDAFPHYLDVADEDSVAALHEAVRSRYGRIDILHNNAADVRASQMAEDAAVTDMTVAVWDRAFEVNTRGTMLMIKHSAPVMAQVGGGSIINTSSGVSILGDTFSPAYSSSKGAINSLTRNVAAQLGRKSIRCNAILPGLILTERASGMLSDEAFRMFERHTLLPRFGVPSDIAALVVFLASDESSFITGQLISIDGGLQAHQPWFGDVADPMKK